MSKIQHIDYSVDYYEILQVVPSATCEEIQRSFRRLAKELHPDKNPDRREWSEARIRELIEANDVLGNRDKRKAFDRVRRLGTAKPKPQEPFFFRKKGPGSRALMVLHLLLNDRPGDAAEIVVEQERELGTTFLSKHLERRDYLDCLFLLGEYYLGEKSYLEALRRLRSFYRLDYASKSRRHYFDEVLRLLKDLYLRKLPRVLSPQSALDYLSEASDLQLNPQENLLRLKKVAESQARMGDRAAARQTLEEIQVLHPDVTGLERIEELLAS